VYRRRRKGVRFLCGRPRRGPGPFARSWGVASATRSVAFPTGSSSRVAARAGWCVRPESGCWPSGCWLPGAQLTQPERWRPSFCGELPLWSTSWPSRLPCRCVAAAGAPWACDLPVLPPGARRQPVRCTSPAPVTRLVWQEPGRFAACWPGGGARSGCGAAPDVFGAKGPPNWVRAPSRCRPRPADAPLLSDPGLVRGATAQRISPVGSHPRAVTGLATKSCATQHPRCGVGAPRGATPDAEPAGSCCVAAGACCWHRPGPPGPVATRPRLNFASPASRKRPGADLRRVRSDRHTDCDARAAGTSAPGQHVVTSRRTFHWVPASADALANAGLFPPRLGAPPRPPTLAGSASTGPSFAHRKSATPVSPSARCRPCLCPALRFLCPPA